jgi:Uncharacterised protein family UPF0547.
MIQMVGRGLRTVAAVEYPGVVKTDCIILDFGISSLLHGNLEQNIDLDGSEPTGVFMQMECPSCGADIPLSSSACPICGHEFRKVDKEIEKDPVSSVEMMEINLLERSSFEWVDLFGDDASFISSGFNAWGGVFYINGSWYAVGGKKGSSISLLQIGERVVCLAAADDWINENETEETAYKTRKWLQEQPTEKQVAILPSEYKLDFNITRYQASAKITFKLNRDEIIALVKDHM